MMMPEISLHILDIAENSVSAGAKHIAIAVDADHVRDTLRVSVGDDGRGMDEEFLKNVVSPFITTRTTRKVGLGIPFFKAGAEACDGEFELESELGKGTDIAASYRISHIDRPPLGDMAETMLALICCHTDVDFLFTYKVDEREFRFSTEEVREALGADIPLNEPQVAAWIKDCLKEGIEELNGGV